MMRRSLSYIRSEKSIRYVGSVSLLCVVGRSGSRTIEIDTPTLTEYELQLDSLAARIERM